MKRFYIAAALSCIGLAAMAQTTLQQIAQNTELGGYFVGQGKITDQEDADVKSNFDTRYVRLYLDGKVSDFQYKLQFQLNGSYDDKKGNAPRALDIWAEWQKYDYVRVRAGQFKRGITFENPMNPWDYGAGGGAQIVSKLAGGSDRVGEHTCNGRDLGVQVQGDLFPVGTAQRKLLHYQLGIYNGQGINHSDANSKKDYIGGLILRPFKGMQLGAFGWYGDFVKNGITVDRRRVAFGAKYDGDFCVRTEYMHSKGRKVGADAEGNACVVGADCADGWYTMIGKPIGEHLRLYVKYDVYRDTGHWDSTKSIYNLTADYYFTKNLKIQLNLQRTHDRLLNASGQDGDYNSADLQLYLRF